MALGEKILDFFGLGLSEDEELDDEEQTSAEEREETLKKSKKAQEERRQEISHPVSVKGDMFLVEPSKRGDAKIVCDELMDSRIVVINVKNISPEESVRLLDFIQGAVYTLGGKMRRISEEVIVAAPKGVDIQTNQVDLDQDYIDDDDNDELEYGY